ncbi:hypothetical protein ACVWWG_000202 [Bradyrhizobium sp. LB7.2]
MGPAPRPGRNRWALPVRSAGTWQDTLGKAAVSVLDTDSELADDVRQTSYSLRQQRLYWDDMGRKFITTAVGLLTERRKIGFAPSKSINPVEKGGSPETLSSNYPVM